ncbi:hypothetical protein, partial [Xanthomonas albilineans]|uniref:hypothetical protein n=1 Tax=Xanthomonas albilineans TaxID=29447 RepID=UPI001E320B60
YAWCNSVLPGCCGMNMRRYRWRSGAAVFRRQRRCSPRCSITDMALRQKMLPKQWPGREFRRCQFRRERIIRWPFPSMMLDRVLQ